MAHQTPTLSEWALIVLALLRPAFSAPTLGAGLSRISALERFDLGALAPVAAPNS